jgi:CMP-N,N'-diacetyllegionaminic acid synthase
MKVLGVVPARGGSKGIPKKNIKLLNGKPLIAYTIEAAINSNLDRVVVSTDCEEISRISKSYGITVIIRSKELSKDDTPTLRVLQDVMKIFNNSYDAIMTLQPTSPFRTSEHIDESIEIFSRNEKANSLVSVVKVPHNFLPEKLMVYDGKYLSGNNNPKRRQESSTRYARNGAAIYITRSQMLDKYIFGGKIIPYFMSKIQSIDIDDLEDWVLAEKLITNEKNI